MKIAHYEPWKSRDIHTQVSFLQGKPQVMDELKSNFVFVYTNEHLRSDLCLRE